MPFCATGSAPVAWEIGLCDESPPAFSRTLFAKMHVEEVFRDSKITEIY